LFYFEITASISQISRLEWNQLISHPDASPFIRHEYLEALESSESVGINTGWQPCHFVVREKNSQNLLAALPAYLKSHSYGEYVFDWSWANAYQQNGLAYYPKLLCAIPFTPVGGSRILAKDSIVKEFLLKAVLEWITEKNISSFHILFPTEDEEIILKKMGFLRRESIQFHWQNCSLDRPGETLNSFEEFLYTLNKKRRNNILRERNSIINAGLSYEHKPGYTLSKEDWDDFYLFYATNYFNHGNAPYLKRAFFEKISHTMPENIHLIFANYLGRRIACSLLFRDRKEKEKAYGRYWGSSTFINNLHFETAYYQSIEFCIKEKFRRLKGALKENIKFIEVSFLSIYIQCTT
jgi:predicted N-acyltransferase